MASTTSATVTVSARRDSWRRAAREMPLLRPQHATLRGRCGAFASSSTGTSCRSGDLPRAGGLFPTASMNLVKRNQARSLVFLRPSLGMAWLATPAQRTPGRYGPRLQARGTGAPPAGEPSSLRSRDAEPSASKLAPLAKAARRRPHLPAFSGCTASGGTPTRRRLELGVARPAVAGVAQVDLRRVVRVCRLLELSGSEVARCVRAIVRRAVFVALHSCCASP